MKSAPRCSTVCKSTYPDIRTRFTVLVYVPDKFYKNMKKPPFHGPGPLGKRGATCRLAFPSFRIYDISYERELEPGSSLSRLQRREAMRCKRVCVRCFRVFFLIFIDLPLESREIFLKYTGNRVTYCIWYAVHTHTVKNQEGEGPRGGICPPSYGLRDACR